MPALPTAVLTDISDAIRSGILADLPEIMDIEDEVLREQVIAAWALSLRDSPFNRISEIPGEGAPNHFVLRNGTQEVHLRGVAHLAMGVVDEFRRSSPGVDVDRDIVLAGALCHDIGKCWECDPANQERWSARPDKVGYRGAASISSSNERPLPEGLFSKPASPAFSARLHHQRDLAACSSELLRAAWSYWINSRRVLSSR